jgi:hypothetical protein
MLIYDVLKKDHEKVKELLTELIHLDDDSTDRSELITKIHDELVPHSRAEEAVFYNSIRAMKLSQDVIRHSYQEHMEAETLLMVLRMKDKIDADWRKTAVKLKEALEHHIEEEEARIFSVAKTLFTEEEATQFADAFERMKPKIQEEGFLGTTADLIANLMPPRFSKTLRGEDSSPHV